MVRQIGALAALLALFACGAAVAALGARRDAPLKSQTYTDPAGDQQSGAPDITGVVVENSADGTIGFHIALPQEYVLTNGHVVGVFVDSDANRATGDGGSDYLLSAAGSATAPPSIELLQWSGTAWQLVDPKGLTGSFTSLAGVDFTIPAARIGVTSRFDFRVRAVVSAAGVVYADDAPGGSDFFSYELGTPAAPTTSTSPAATTTTVAKPAQKPKRKPAVKHPKPKKH